MRELASYQWMQRMLRQIVRCRCRRMARTLIAWGVTALSHDAALAVIVDGRLVFASSAERYSRVKSDSRLNVDLIAAATRWGEPDRVVWYERPGVKRVRQITSGQVADALDVTSRARAHFRSISRDAGVAHPPRLSFVGHHRAHALAGATTAHFTRGAVLVADAIGEFTTMSIWRFRSSPMRLECLRRWRYPDSIGLLYSAMTQRCGFKPNDEEYIVMGLAAYGEPVLRDRIAEDFIDMHGSEWSLKRNVHRGVGDWEPAVAEQDVAASIQSITEDVVIACAAEAVRISGETSLVLAGGVALNCVANSRIARSVRPHGIHIFPSPGDAGSSVGAAASQCGEQIEWPDGPYLGQEIAGRYPVADLVDSLEGKGIVGVASGRAEFGPRALGNRSILADPRPVDMKDRVNGYKGREPFRPFAPVVREEDAEDHFDMPVERSPYMQFTAVARDRASLPAVCHVDGTSRVQTVSSTQHPGLYELLTEWKRRTGCGVLLNTSLNGHGEPLVNTRADADQFERTTGLRVVS